MQGSSDNRVSDDLELPKNSGGGDDAPCLTTENGSVRKAKHDQEVKKHMADLAEIATLRNIANGGDLDQSSRHQRRKRSSVHSPTIYAMRSPSIFTDIVSEPAEEAGQASEVCANLPRVIPEER